MTQTIWSEIDPTLLDITARLADILTAADREALATYLSTTDLSPAVQDQVDVMSRAAYDLDMLALVTLAWPFAP